MAGKKEIHIYGFVRIQKENYLIKNLITKY